MSQQYSYHQAPAVPRRLLANYGTSSAFSPSASPDENWTQIFSDSTERRRIQNRIAQRIYRKNHKRRLEDLERREGSSDFTWTDFDVLERIIGKSPMEVAKMFTDADNCHFRQLCPEDFKTSSPRLREMSRWSELASVVKACCIVYGNSGILDPLSKISKCLIDHRNYYSATAFLTGIQNARCCPDSLSSSLRYIYSGVGALGFRFYFLIFAR